MLIKPDTVSRAKSEASLSGPLKVALRGARGHDTGVRLDSQYCDVGVACCLPVFMIPADDQVYLIAGCPLLRRSTMRLPKTLTDQPK